VSSTVLFIQRSLVIILLRIVRVKNIILPQHMCTKKVHC